MTEVSPSPKRQCVWIVRYGLTKFNLLERVGPFDSELDPEEGVQHAKCIAKRIAGSGADAPKVVYSSPFSRTAHTAQLLALELPHECDRRVRIEEGLTEWLTPSLLVRPNGVKTEPRSAKDLCEVYGTIDPNYRSVNPIVPDDEEHVPDGAPHFVESEEALLKRCSTTLSRLLDASDGDSIALISHAPCDQAMAFYLEGANSPEESKLGPLALGGITMFSRTVQIDGTCGEWTMDFYGDTSHMPGKYKLGIMKWSLPCLAESTS